MREMTPRQTVSELDKHIVGQGDAKRAVAIALRNRWRWNNLPDEIRNEVTPKNIIMIGPTGVGKTEITRRLAKLTGAPFIKVEASKYTEVGYYGRDVESMVRDLVDAAINLVTAQKRIEIEEVASQRVEERLLDLLVPGPDWDAADEAAHEESVKRHERTREKFRKKLKAGELEEREVELTVEQRQSPVQVFSSMGGMEQMDIDFQSMFERIMPKQSRERDVTVAEARQVLLEQEAEALMDRDAINEESIALAEANGIVFLDELDKICGAGEGSRGADVSRQGVQRDLLPIVEGTTVQTRYGSVQTDHMLFIAAGAFHQAKLSDLMPELQGRLPIRVELDALVVEDFERILVEPDASLTEQYSALMETEGVQLDFAPDAIRRLAEIAHQVNETTENIGARRLHTVMERLLDVLSFDASDRGQETITIDAAYVEAQLTELAGNEDLSRYIL